MQNFVKAFRRRIQLQPELIAKNIAASSLLPQTAISQQKLIEIDLVPDAAMKFRTKADEKLALINCLLNLGKTNAAEIAFHRSWRENVQFKHYVDIRLVNNFIEVFLSDLNDPDREARAMEWFYSLDRDFNLKPSVHTYAILIHHFLSTSQPKKAEEMINTMEQSFPVKMLFLDAKFFEKDDCILLTNLLENMNRSSPVDETNLLIAALRDLTDEEEMPIIEMNEIEKLKSSPLNVTNTYGAKLLHEAIDQIMDLKITNLYNKQMAMEHKSHAIASLQWKYQNDKIPAQHKPVSVPKSVLQMWIDAIVKAIKKLDDHDYIKPFIQLIPPDVIAKITVYEVIKAASTRNSEKIRTQYSSISLANSIGKAIEKENIIKLFSKKDGNTFDKVNRKIYLMHRKGNLFDRNFHKILAKMARTSEANSDYRWTDPILLKIGSYLLQQFIELAKMPVKKIGQEGETITEDVPCIHHFIEIKNGHKYGSIIFNEDFIALISNFRVQINPWSLPMVIPPLPWLTFNSGGYIQHRNHSVRCNECPEALDLLEKADRKGNLTTFHQALDILGSVPWIINSDIYRVVLQVWNSGDAIAGFSSAFPPPEIEKPLDYETNLESKRAYVKKVSARKAEIRNAFSARCDANYKLDIARAFLGETIYFPHNSDFRGRVYPIPANLNHTGNDLCRGLLKFKEKKKIGSKGLEWMKIHLANLAGNDKVSFADRIKYTEENLENILDSAEKPLTGKGWWLKTDKPWQLLSACMELSNALKLEDPTEFMSNLPIHQDGSCNGLQHYAALGGDVLGAEAVNLVPKSKPADVYMGVADNVKEVVEKDAAKGVKEAILMKNRINRKLVKQSVMTFTYGVTFLGAKEQVKNRLEEAKVHEDKNEQLTDDEIQLCALYITKIIFKSFDVIFERSRELQLWLNTVAKQISSSVHECQLDERTLKDIEKLDSMGLLGPSNADLSAFLESSAQKDVEEKQHHELEAAEGIRRNSKKNEIIPRTSVTWTSPVGLSIVQPYKQNEFTPVATPLQVFKFLDQNCGVSWRKQSQAFPPNFIHSLDASHMMQSALACHERGITFASVHDSYWTHASTVDEMSNLLREAFVKMHSQNLMDRLHREFQTRFGKNLVKTTITLTNPEKLREWEEYKGISKPAKKRVIKTWKPIEFPPLPKRGDFKVESVLDSKYFFH